MAFQPHGSSRSFDSQDEDDDDDDFLAFHELNLMAGSWTRPDDDERQISVDPISLRESSSDASSFRRPEMPPPLPPLNPPHDHFLLTTSFSLPASPRFPSMKTVNTPTTRSRFSNKVPPVDDDQTMQRSKSCGEGRWCSPPDDILFTLPPPPPDDRTNPNKDVDQATGCGALCLYLPGFGKGSKATAALKSRRRKEVVGSSSRMASVISRAVSLERFECGSWASSAAINYMSEVGRNHQNSRYFDLPIEMIRSSNVDNDASSPVASAFFFDSVFAFKGRSSSSSSSSKSQQQLRPSRFSGQQARDDFDALLLAHNNNI